jgi:IclR family transcriptional regulator, pca regulon regulatory protein
VRLSHKGSQMADARAEILERDVVGGLEKGLAVIEAFDERRVRLSLSEVAQITGITRAAARRYLLTLTKLGYAEYDGKFFSLTPKILRLGYAYLSSMTLPTRVQPFLERISETLHESSSAAVLDNVEVVYIARAATRRIMSIGLGVGSRLPAYCTSLGRVLLAHQEPAWLDTYFEHITLKRFTPRTMSSEHAIRDALVEAKEQGYALVDEELELGLRSISVPVIGTNGRLACAINVSVQTGRTSAEELVGQAIPVLNAAARELHRLV